MSFCISVIFRYFSGGIWFTPSLSSAETAQQTHLSGLLLDMVVFGILVVVALYHLILYVQRREDRTPLYFALFCSGIALRLGVMAHFVESLGFARTPEGFEVLMTLEYITAPLAIIGAGLFLSEMMPSAWFKKSGQWLVSRGRPLVDRLHFHRACLNVFFSNLDLRGARRWCGTRGRVAFSSAGP